MTSLLEPGVITLLRVRNNCGAHCIRIPQSRQLHSHLQLFFTQHPLLNSGVYDDPTAKALEMCKNTVLKPYFIFLKLVCSSSFAPAFCGYGAVAMVSLFPICFSLPLLPPLPSPPFPPLPLSLPPFLPPSLSSRLVGGASAPFTTTWSPHCG